MTQQIWSAWVGWLVCSSLVFKSVMEKEETFLETMARVLKEEAPLDAEVLRYLAVKLWFQAKRSVDNKFLKELCTAFVWAADELERDKERAKKSAVYRQMQRSAVKWKENRTPVTSEAGHKAPHGPKV